MACDELVVSAAWIRSAPPSAKVMAGYLTASNPHKQSILLQGAQSDAFSSVEIHKTSVQDGVARMQRLDLIEVKVGQTQSRAPGGAHLMLFNPKRPLKTGDTVDLALKLCEEKQQIVQFTVAESAESLPTSAGKSPTKSAAPADQHEHTEHAHSH